MGALEGWGFIHPISGEIFLIIQHNQRKNSVSLYREESLRKILIVANQLVGKREVFLHNLISPKELKEAVSLWPLAGVHFLQCLSRSWVTPPLWSQYFGWMARGWNSCIRPLSCSPSWSLISRGWYGTWEDLWREALQIQLKNLGIGDSSPSAPSRGRHGLTKWLKLVLGNEVNRIDLLEEAMVAWIWGPETEFRRLLGGLAQEFEGSPLVRTLSPFFLNRPPQPHPEDPLEASFCELFRSVTYANEKAIQG